MKHPVILRTKKTLFLKIFFWRIQFFLKNPFFEEFNFFEKFKFFWIFFFEFQFFRKIKFFLKNLVIFLILNSPYILLLRKAFVKPQFYLFDWLLMFFLFCWPHLYQVATSGLWVFPKLYYCSKGWAESVSAQN